MLLAVAFGGVSVFEVMDRATLPSSNVRIERAGPSVQLRVEQEDVGRAAGTTKLSTRVRLPPLSRVGAREQEAEGNHRVGQERLAEERVRLAVAEAVAQLEVDAELLLVAGDRVVELEQQRANAERAASLGVVGDLEVFERRRALARVETLLRQTDRTLAANERLVETLLGVDVLDLEPWPEVEPERATVQDTEVALLQARVATAKNARRPSLDFVQGDVALEETPEWTVTVGVGIPLPGRTAAKRNLEASASRAEKDLERQRVLARTEDERLEAEHAFWLERERVLADEASVLAGMAERLPEDDGGYEELASLRFDTAVQGLEARRERLLIESVWLSRM